MTREELQTHIVGVLAEKSTSQAPIRSATPLSVLGLASLDVVEVAFELEEVVGRELDLSPDDFADGDADVRTVKWLVDAISKQVGLDDE